jgi:hypothetical protein
VSRARLDCGYHPRDSATWTRPWQLHLVITCCALQAHSQETRGARDSRHYASALYAMACPAVTPAEKTRRRPWRFDFRDQATFTGAFAVPRLTRHARLRCHAVGGGSKTWRTGALPAGEPRRGPGMASCCCRTRVAGRRTCGLFALALPNRASRLDARRRPGRSPTRVFSYSLKMPEAASCYTSQGGVSSPVLLTALIGSGIDGVIPGVMRRPACQRACEQRCIQACEQVPCFAVPRLLSRRRAP